MFGRFPNGWPTHLCDTDRPRGEKRHAQDLQDFVQREVHLPLLLDDGDQHIGANRYPDLRLHGVRRSPIKRLDSQMLLDPSEKQFDLPPTSVDVRDRHRRQVEIVAQEDESLARFDVAMYHSPQGLGVVSRCQWASQKDRLIATQTRGLVHRTRHATVEVEIGFQNCPAMSRTFPTSPETSVIRG